jgi:hypothetical protein
MEALSAGEAVRFKRFLNEDYGKSSRSFLA